MALNTALSRGRYRQFSYLLRTGADVNSRGADGTTPLMLCCHLSDERVAYSVTCCLLRRGADVGIRDRAGRNALLHACVSGRRAHVELFLQPGCFDYDLNDTDKGGNTALHYAVVSGNPDIVQLVVTALQRYDLRLNVRNKRGLTPHGLAVHLGWTECANIISPVLSVCSPTSDGGRAPPPSPSRLVHRPCRVQNRSYQVCELLRGKDVVFTNGWSTLWDMKKPTEDFLAHTGLPRKTNSTKKTSNVGERKVAEKSSAEHVQQLLLVKGLDQLPTFRKAAVPPTDRDVWGRPLAPTPREDTPTKGRNLLKVVALVASRPDTPPRTVSEPNLLRKSWKKSAFVSRRRTASTASSVSPPPGTQRPGSERAGSAAGQGRRLFKDVLSSAADLKNKSAVSTTVPTGVGQSGLTTSAPSTAAGGHRQPLAKSFSSAEMYMRRSTDV